MRPGPRLPETVALVAATTFFFCAPVQAQQDHAHAHAQAGAAVTRLELNAGAKGATDESLRTGMAAIRGAFDADHGAIHAGKESDAQYAALADRIERQVQTIVANCKLPADADANLHYIVADLLQGVSLMRGADPQRSRHDGAALVHGVLRAYPQYFDDANWRVEKSAH
jgi:hypothetical protein